MQQDKMVSSNKEVIQDNSPFLEQVVSKQQELNNMLHGVLSSISSLRIKFTGHLPINPDDVDTRDPNKLENYVDKMVYLQSEVNDKLISIFEELDKLKQYI